MAGAEPVRPPRQGVLVFIPWTTVEAAVDVAGVRFVPWRDARGALSQELADVERELEVVLAAYVERTGDPVTNCSIAMTQGGGALFSEADLSVVRLGIVSGSRPKSGHFTATVRGR